MFSGVVDRSLGSVNPAFLALQYDVLKDFEPVALTASVPLLIVAKKAMSANHLDELIAWLKANPEKASEGKNTSHLAAILFQRETGAHLALVPYRGPGRRSTTGRFRCWRSCLLMAAYLSPPAPIKLVGAGRRLQEPRAHWNLKGRKRRKPLYAS